MLSPLDVAILPSRVIAAFTTTYGHPRSTAWFLGRNRIVREAVIVAVLAAATAMPIGLATYGAAVTDSVRTTVDGEAHLAAGRPIEA